MTILGRIRNGVVVMNGGAELPEGAEVSVSYPVATTVESDSSRRAVDLPLVHSSRPGSRMLTAERVAELLEREDVPS